MFGYKVSAVIQVVCGDRRRAATIESSHVNPGQALPRPYPGTRCAQFLFIILIERVLVSQTLPLHLLGGDPVLQVRGKDMVLPMMRASGDAGVGCVALCPLPQLVAVVLTRFSSGVVKLSHPLTETSGHPGRK